MAKGGGFATGNLRGGPVGVVDHRLARQHLINEFRRGRLAQHQVCDAHPELIRAARALGDPGTVACPICEEAKVVLVTYVFGPRLPSFGRCISSKREMVELNRRSDDLTAYFVEVCPACRWHHLLRVVPIGGKKRRVRAAVTGP